MTVDTARNATTTGTAPSLTKYMDDKNSVMVYSATAGMGTAPLKDASDKVKAAVAHPYILGFDRGMTTPAVEKCVPGGEIFRARSFDSLGSLGSSNQPNRYRTGGV